jgi:hypothetical protein
MKQYSMARTIAEMKAGQSDYTACIVTVTMLYSNSQPELPKN